MSALILALTVDLSMYIKLILVINWLWHCSTEIHHWWQCCLVFPHEYSLNYNCIPVQYWYFTALWKLYFCVVFGVKWNSMAVGIFLYYYIHKTARKINFIVIMSIYFLVQSNTVWLCIIKRIICHNSIQMSAIIIANYTRDSKINDHEEFLSRTGRFEKFPSHAFIYSSYCTVPNTFYTAKSILRLPFSPQILHIVATLQSIPSDVLCTGFVSKNWIFLSYLCGYWPSVL